MVQLKEEKAISKIEKSLFTRFGHLEIYFENDKEIIKITSEYVEVGGDNYLAYIPKDSLTKKHLKAKIGITLMNFFNKKEDIMELLKNELELNQKTTENNFNILEHFINLKKNLLSKFPNELEMNVIITSFLEDFIQNFVPECNKEKLYMQKGKWEIKGTNNYFYSEMFKYLCSIEDKRFYGKTHWYDNFSCKKTYETFILYLIHAINFMEDNITKDIDIPEEYKKEKLEIRNFESLFYISKYQLDIHNKLLKQCKNCNFYFITEERRTETACTRPCGENNTCRKIAHNSYRSGSGIPNKISSARNSINGLIKSRIKSKAIDKEQLEIFQNIFDEKRYDLGIISHYTELNDKTAEEFLEWLQTMHHNMLHNSMYLLKYRNNK